MLNYCLLKVIKDKPLIYYSLETDKANKLLVDITIKKLEALKRDTFTRDEIQEALTLAFETLEAIVKKESIKYD
jgi:hypothetical protein